MFVEPRFAQGPSLETQLEGTSYTYASNKCVRNASVRFKSGPDQSYVELETVCKIVTAVFHISAELRTAAAERKQKQQSCYRQSFFHDALIVTKGAGDSKRRFKDILNVFMTKCLNVRIHRQGFEPPRRIVLQMSRCCGLRRQPRGVILPAVAAGDMK